MSKQTKKGSNIFKCTADHGDFKVYTHQLNGLTLLHYPKPGTGVVTSNITYKVGSVDEKRGESGLAHMLEHMLFKPTKQDLKNKITNGAGMQFERETGAALNANTAYDRTTYYFSYPKHHLDTVMEIEANRMQDVVLSDKQFQPERGNVLSEFDMYNSDPYFALEVAMRTATFTSHAYDHEIIGFREDIEDYTTDKLQRFYEMYYQPNNATLMLIGDITKTEALAVTTKYFSTKKNTIETIHREVASEPKIKGPRQVTVKRPGTTNLLALGFVHAGFPEQKWFAANIALGILASGPESILHKALIDTGLVSSLDHAVFGSAQPNMGLLFARLASNTTHKHVNEVIFATLSSLDKKSITSLLKKEQTKLLTSKAFTRSNTLGVAAELTEYVAANSLGMYSKYADSVKAVRSKDILETISDLFNPDTLTTGYYTSI